MTERTVRTTVTFAHPFSIEGVDGVRPPGTYVVETDEELIPGMSFHAYRRTATLLVLPGTAGSSITGEVVAVDPAELQKALDRDAATAAATNRTARDGGSEIKI